MSVLGSTGMLNTEVSNLTSKLPAVTAERKLPYGPLILSASVFLEVTAAIVLLSVVQNQGHLVYNVDDAYIHMAMAKNFSLHSVWGVTRYGFSSSTSSPLCTLILDGLYLVFVVHNSIPLLMNIDCA